MSAAPPELGSTVETRRGGMSVTAPSGSERTPGAAPGDASRYTSVTCARVATMRAPAPADPGGAAA
ncbi:hypothetical protein [Nannocystis bainbridge]|uniref:Uncharacterized protein n=1 Tax=Nannocystis bainbridge TaxID=2995303 RepID=A0ABT5DQT0_9BACT|nr:hypothetical protein [Nannocystis bainbridge]MDC0715911.1 hypothetical protein [Nannocystis bainbridge]